MVDPRDCSGFRYPAVISQSVYSARTDGRQSVTVHPSVRHIPPTAAAAVTRFKQMFDRILVRQETT